MPPQMGLGSARGYLLPRRWWVPHPEEPHPLGSSQLSGTAGWTKVSALESSCSKLSKARPLSQERLNLAPGTLSKEIGDLQPLVLIGPKDQGWG